MALVIVSRIIGERLDSEKLYSFVEIIFADLATRNLLETRGKLWIQVKLALRLNRLHELHLICGDNLVLDKVVWVD